MLKALRVVFHTECLLLLRRSQEWLYPLVFFLILMMLFPLAYTPDADLLQKLMPGCVWIAALLASLLSIQNVFLTEMEEGDLEQIVMSSVPLSFYIAIKLCVQWLVTELPLIVLTPILGVLFHLSSSAILVLCMSLLLGTPILTLIGSLGVALTLGLRQQGVLVGLIIFPLVVPVLIFGVNIVQQAQEGFNIFGALMFLGGLMVFAVTVMPFVIAVVLRMGLED